MRTSRATCTAFDRVQALVRIERVDLEESGEVQAEDDDDDSGKERERAMILLGDLPDAGGHAPAR